MLILPSNTHIGQTQCEEQQPIFSLPHFKPSLIPFHFLGCMNFTYDPYEFAIHMNMIMNGNSIYSSTVSGMYDKYRLEIRLRLFDIHTPGQNLHMCLNFETRIQRATVLILHFNCMRMGADGVALVKPGEGSEGISATTESQVDSDKYDEVTEIKYKNRNRS
ncbi:hypothetical protein ILUMI_06725 [Ignelater luminosus]|uniref:DUF4773 domain-containing protein n=1 Tax=Ignelater luminosus TaxID=2038154 RepID=A0A8K0D9P3_IGNLU|nr:hypothetical protein ILUMI_06725 [Ignelater luminosus]